MFLRFLSSIAVGALVGGALQEGLLAGLALFTARGNPLDRLLDASMFDLPSQLLLLATWTLAATCSSAMAAALARNLLAGWIAAALWLIPVGLLIGLKQPEANLLLAGATSCLLGALIGSRLQTRNPH